MDLVFVGDLFRRLGEISAAQLALSIYGMSLLLAIIADIQGDEYEYSLPLLVRFPLFLLGGAFFLLNPGLGLVALLLVSTWSNPMTRKAKANPSWQLGFVALGLMGLLSLFAAALLLDNDRCGLFLYKKGLLAAEGGQTPSGFLPCLSRVVTRSHVDSWAEQVLWGVGLGSLLGVCPFMVMAISAITGHSPKISSVPELTVFDLVHGLVKVLLATSFLVALPFCFMAMRITDLDSFFPLTNLTWLFQCPSFFLSAGGWLFAGIFVTGGIRFKQ